MKRIFYILMVLVTLSISCNLTPGGGKTPTPPAASPTPTREPFAPIEPPEFASSLAASLRARVAAGEWTLEEGLVSSLKFIAGEAGLDSLGPSGLELYNRSGSSVLRVARAYLTNGADEAAKAEIERLLALILPDPERLKLYSRPYQADSTRASVAMIAYSAQTVDCGLLWEGGFPVESAAVCFEERTVAAGGQTYEIYFPASWPAGDPRRRYFDWTADAVRDSVEGYLAYGAMPSGTIVFTLLGDPEEPDTGAATTVLDRGGTCQIAVYPNTSDVDEDYFKQLIAHELFHCYQFENYWDQTAIDGGDWWVEGTAEYFSNVIYPRVDAEAQYWNAFDAQSISMPLLDMDYSNEVFFQYLANVTGNEGILALIAGMPATGERSAHLARLSAYPDIESLFHNFAKAYLEMQIVDTGGGPIAVTPGVDRIRTFDVSHTETIPVRSFLLARALFIFPEDKRQVMEEEKPDGTTSAAEERGMYGSWAELPTEIAAACNAIAYIYTATTTSGADTEEEIRVTSTTEEFEGECDPCVVGNWQLENTSHWDAFTALLADMVAVPNLVSMSGGVTADFTSGGTMTIHLEDFYIHYTQDVPGMHADATMNINGDYRSGWYTDTAAGTLFSMNPTTVPNYDVQVTVTQGGLTTTVRPPINPFWSGLSLYQCSGDVLQIDSLTPSGVDGQYVIWNRTD